MSKLILYAPNIHIGGGKTLLIGLLKTLEGQDCLLILDQRLEYSNKKNNILMKVHPTFKSRLRAEIALKNNSKLGDIILCFHSIPPLFKSKAKVIVFFNNMKLIGSFKLVLNENFKAIFRVVIEKILSRFFYKNVDEWLVQTQSVKRSLDFYYSNKMSLVSVYPFVDAIDTSSLKNVTLKKEFEFIYVSLGLRHKNHINLLKAWVFLAEHGIYPRLTLTLTIDNRDTLREMSRLIEKHHLKIENIGWVDHYEVLEIYSNSKALIYPSLIESFGLPLIEAKNLNLPILASELDYVRDVCNPDETFDPTSYVSIAKAVMRFLKLQQNEDYILTSKEFIDKLYADNTIQS